jgi:hypothetical protein
MSPRHRLAAVLAVLLAAAPGCGDGGGGAEDDVRAAWNQAADAIATGSATDFCARVSETGKAAILKRVGMGCEDAVRLLASRLGAADRRAIADADITAVDVEGDAATVTYRTTPGLAVVGFTGRTQLVRGDGGWLLEGI